MKCISNFGKAGSRLEIRRRGEYFSFVTLVESKPNRKFDESNPSYSTPSLIFNGTIAYKVGSRGALFT